MKKKNYLPVTLFLLFPLLIFSQSKRVLTISGGGARGAWGGGVAKQLVVDSGRHYRAIFGTSSGSLLAPMIALGDFTRTEIGFTQVNQKDIFDKNPFKKNGEIKGFSTFLKVIFGSKNLGETHNLKHRILNFFSESDYENLRKQHTVVVSTVSLSTNRLMYRSSDTIANYKAMVDWVWASANQPIFMTPVLVHGEFWVDGGVKENVPVAKAIEYARENSIDSVDVIILNTSTEHMEKWPGKKKDNIINKILRVINIFSDEIKLSDIEIGVLQAKGDRPVCLQLYFMNEEEFAIAPNSNLFKSEKQKQLWQKGYKHIFLSNKIVKLNDVKINNVAITVFD